MKKAARERRDRSSISVLGMQKTSYGTWIVGEISINDVAVVVRLEPQPASPDGKTAISAISSKSDLIFILETVRQGCLISNLLRPVVGIAVVSDDAYRKEVLRWCGDQHWHQGRFCLYAVKYDQLPPNSDQAVEAKLDSYDGRKEDILTPSAFEVRRPARGVDPRTVLTDALNQLRSGAKNDKTIEGFCDKLLTALVPKSADRGRADSKSGAVRPEQTPNSGESLETVESIGPNFGEALIDWAAFGIEGFVGTKGTTKNFGYETREWANSRSLFPDTHAKPTTAGSNRLYRMNSLEVSGFRGIPNNAPLKLDSLGDIVVIVAGNGLGKSSILEIIMLLLTKGLLNPDRDERALFHNSKGGAASVMDHQFEAKAFGKLEHLDSSSVSISGKWTMTDDMRGETVYSWDGDLALLDPDVKEGKPKFPTLDTRLCAYTQDNANQLFDDIRHATTLSVVLDSIPAEIRDTTSALDSLIRYLRDEEESIGDRISSEEKDRVEKGWGQYFSDKLLPLIRKAFECGIVPLGFLAPDPGMDNAKDDPRLWYGFPLPPDVRLDESQAAVYMPIEVLTDIGDQAKKKRADMIGQSTKSADAKEIRDVKSQLAELRAKRGISYSREMVLLKTAIAAFQGMVELRRVIDLVNDEKKRAFEFERQNIVPEETFDELSHLIEDVPVNEYQRLLGRLTVRLSETEKLDNDIAKLARNEEEMEAQYAKGEAFEALRALIDDAQNLESDNLPWKRAADYAQRSDRREWDSNFKTTLEKRRMAMEGLRHKIDLGLQEDAPWLGEVRSALVRATSRFWFAGDLWPVRLKRSEDKLALALVGTDDRNESMLSTGQRSQLAVSYMVAQNLMLTKLLGHRVLLLDDVTTAYDLTNLVRESIVWRQMAYGYSGADDWPATRRQLFMCVHNDDMSRHLIDLLLPPGGKSLTVVRVTDWELDTGPCTESTQERPTYCVFSPTADNTPARSAIHRMAQHIREVLQ